MTAVSQSPAVFKKLLKMHFFDVAFSSCQFLAHIDTVMHVWSYCNRCTRNLMTMMMMMMMMYWTVNSQLWRHFSPCGMCWMLLC